jgi:hypothetical protein
MKALPMTFLFLSVTALAAPPGWVHQNGIQQNGSILVVVSTGVGPSLDLARRSAIDQAKGTAADQANGSANIQSLSIEMEKTASFHSEVSSAKKVEGLTCKPLNEYSENKDDIYSVWIKCQFDLKKARVQVVDKESARSEVTPGSKKDVTSGFEIVGGHMSTPAPEVPKATHGEDQHLILSVVPSCDSILIRGKQSRTIFCKENPMTILVLPTDGEIIIRGPSGFAPKHLKVHDDGKGRESESMEVYLEKM